MESNCQLSLTLVQPSDNQMDWLLRIDWYQLDGRDRHVTMLLLHPVLPHHS
jgi:hypothetical protein